MASSEALHSADIATDSTIALYFSAVAVICIVAVDKSKPASPVLPMILLRSVNEEEKWRKLFRTAAYITINIHINNNNYYIHGYLSSLKVPRAKIQIDT